MCVLPRKKNLLFNRIFQRSQIFNFELYHTDLQYYKISQGTFQSRVSDAY